MKYRLTVTVTLDDPNIYHLDSDGWPVGQPDGKVEKLDVAEYLATAAACWGGQYAPGHPFFSHNIKQVRVTSRDTYPVLYRG